MESSPYIYRPQPSRDRDISIPQTILTLDWMQALAEKQGILTPDMAAQIHQLRQLNINLLTKGDYRPPKAESHREPDICAQNGIFGSAVESDSMSNESCVKA